MNRVISKITKLFAGREIHNAPEVETPSYTPMVEAFRIGYGCIFSGVFSQTGTSAPIPKANYPVHNPYNLILATTSGYTASVTPISPARTSAGVYTFGFGFAESSSPFAALDTIDPPDLTKLRIRVQNHKSGKIITSAALSLPNANTTQLIATVTVRDVANIAAAALVAEDLVGDLSIEIFSL